MKIALRDFRGCSAADLECAPIALVAGRNAAGKTSLAQAIGAAVCGNALPVTGLQKSMAGMLVRSGAASASVEIEGDTGGIVRMSWPTGRASREGDAPESSEYAAGLASIVSLSPRDRARVLSDVLQAEPTFEDVSVALAARGWKKELIAAAWGVIEAQGWDSAWSERRDRGAELKGRWRQVTGANYGSRIAASWRPDLADLDENELTAAVTRARQTVEGTQAAATLSAAERQRLVDEADTLEQRQQDADAAAAEARQRAEDHRAAQYARAALPPAERRPTAPCPYCGEPIIVRAEDLAGAVRLEKPDSEPLRDSEVKQRRLAIAEHDGRIGRASDALNAARNRLAIAEAAVESAKAARERIANWSAAPAAATGVDLDAARAELARAEKRLAEFHVKRQADDLHAQVERNDVLLEILAGDGLRAQKLTRVLDLFVNRQLRALTDAADWAPIAIDTDLVISMGLPYALLSKSEQYRVRTVFAVAMALIDGSDLIVLDEADVLDGPTRSGLFRLLDVATQEGRCVLVCMTASRRDQVPDLATIGLGASYWIENGVAERIVSQARAA